MNEVADLSNNFQHFFTLTEKNYTITLNPNLCIDTSKNIPKTKRHLKDAFFERVKRRALIENVANAELRRPQIA